MAAGVTAGTVEEDLAPDIKKNGGVGGWSATGKKNENWRQKRREAEMERRSGGRMRNG